MANVIGMHILNNMKCIITCKISQKTNVLRLIDNIQLEFSIKIKCINKYYLETPTFEFSLNPFVNLDKNKLLEIKKNNNKIIETIYDDTEFNDIEMGYLVFQYMHPTLKDYFDYLDPIRNI